MTAYAADMNVLFSYYKCKDDWQDERKITKLAEVQCLKTAFSVLAGKYPQKVKKIASLMREIALEEKKQTDDIDRMSGLFGDVMAEIMVYKVDEWANSLRTIGWYLGKFIYLCDAYEDIEKDLKDGNYNPFKKKWENPDFEEECNTILTLLMAECSKEFEKLPILDPIEILRNILYSGVWYRYETVKAKREKEQEKQHE